MLQLISVYFDDSGCKRFSVIDYDDFVVESCDEDFMRLALSKGIPIRGINLETMSTVKTSKEILYLDNVNKLLVMANDVRDNIVTLQVRGRDGRVLYAVDYSVKEDVLEEPVSVSIVRHFLPKVDAEFLEISFRYEHEDLLGDREVVTWVRSHVLYLVGNSKVQPILTESYYQREDLIKPIGFVSRGVFGFRGSSVKCN